MYSKLNKHFMTLFIKAPNLNRKLFPDLISVLVRKCSRSIFRGNIYYIYANTAWLLYLNIWPITSYKTNFVNSGGKTLCEDRDNAEKYFKQSKIRFFGSHKQSRFRPSVLECFSAVSKLYNCSWFFDRYQLIILKQISA